MSSDIWSAVDRFVDAFSRLNEAEDIEAHFDQARNTIAKRCGNCTKWLKSGVCPKERGVMKGGPSMDARACDQFELESWIAELAKKRFIEATERMLLWQAGKPAPRKQMPAPKPRARPVPISDQFGVSVQSFMAGKITAPRPANNSRDKHWRASSESCYCSACNHPPCRVCEHSAECVICGSIELSDEMEERGDEFICSICAVRESIRRVP